MYRVEVRSRRNQALAGTDAADYDVDVFEPGASDMAALAVRATVGMFFV